MPKKLYRAYETDASQIEGKAKEVIVPKSVDGAARAIGGLDRVVPRGGGTGLAGGAVPLHGKDVVLDLSKLNKIDNLDKKKRSIEVEGGVILDDLQDYLDSSGLEFPVNPSSHAVCTIGGMIATDAVGSRAIKYGPTSKWVQWIDVVDCEGKIHRKGATEISDYAGMEGITGVIVRANLKLKEKVSRTASILSRESIDEILAELRELKRDSSVSMIEYIDRQISGWLGLRNSFHLIVEYESGEGDLSGQNYGDLMALRDRIYPVVAENGYTHIEDPQAISDKLGGILKSLDKNRVPTFGHLSVGIIHPCFKKEQMNLIPDLMKAVKRLMGKVSGEHGIGLSKKEYVEFNDKKILENIKKRCDSKSKFNVGKVI